jgi:glycosyltransferase involved in cell wall biosynthesis
MRIALVVPSAVPSTYGGAERAWSGISRAFDELTPHRCEIVACPSPEATLGDVAQSYLRFMDTRLDDFDAVLSSKYPAWMVDHPFHDVFLFHRLRGLYDTYPADLPARASTADPELAPLLRWLRRPPRRDDAHVAAELAVSLTEAHPDHPALGHPGPVGRELVRHLDRVGMQPTPHRRYSALSRTVATRAESLPDGVPVRIVSLPSDLAGLGPGRYEHFFTVSRLDHPKRIDLLVQAYRAVPGDIPFFIAGTGGERARLEELAEADDRVHLLGAVGDAELAGLYRDARAVLFAPSDEDWGLVAVEAFASGTAVVTCHDSGGPAELVEHGRTGLVVDPSVPALAAAVTRLVEEPGLDERLGAEALRRSELITWERVVEALDPQREPAGRSRVTAKDSWRRRSSKVVVLSTFPMHPPQHGGQRRGWNLYRRLAEHVDVELLCLAQDVVPPSVHEVEPGVLQRVVPRSAEHRALEVEWDIKAEIPVGDVVAGLLLEHSPTFEAAARRSLADCDLVVLADPFLLEVVERFAPGVPYVYDAYNCELDLKRAIITTAAADVLLERVAELEGRATRGAAHRIACSEDDARRLAELYGVDATSIDVIPNGVDTEAIPFTTGAERRQAGARWRQRAASLGLRQEHLTIFVGSYHLPNIAAARQIIQMAPDHPTTTFVLLGQHCEGLGATTIPPNVVPAGRVSESTKLVFLRAASVALNPITVGSGTNLKLVEFLAAGVPTVTTPTGARGVPLEDRVHARVVDAEHVGAAMEDLFLDADPEMAHAGRALVARSFDWALLGRRFAAAVLPPVGAQRSAG